MTARGVYEDDETVARNHLEALLASGVVDRQIPAVTDLSSLRTAIRYGDSRPYARFVAVKGAAALGRIDLLPNWPEVAEVPVHVNRVTARITASGGLVAAATGRPLLPPGKPRSLTDEERHALRERVHGKARGGHR